MKTATKLSPLWPALLLGSVLTACGASSAPIDGTRPTLPTGAEVRHPAAAVGVATYLSLANDAGASVYQIPVTPDSTVTEIDPALLSNKQTGNTVAIETLIPPTASGVTVSPAGAQVLRLHWVMWQDKNSDGQLSEGEALPLLTHDEVVYAGQAVSVSFQTIDPKMAQTWQFSQGWNRAEHYVYLPKGGDTFQRSLTTNALQRYELHQLTPITSM